MRPVANLVLFSLLLAFRGLTSLSAQELYVNRAVVAGDTQTVGSVSILTGGGDAARLDRLLATPLPNLSSHPALIPARDLQNELIRKDLGNLIIVGGPIVYLPPAITKQGEQSFYASLLQTIETALPERSLRIEVWPSGGLRPDLSSLHGRLQFRFPAGSQSPAALAANSFVEYKGMRDQSYRFLPIHLRVSALVPVARKDIASGARFSDSAIGYVTKNLADLAGTPAKISGNRFQAEADIAKGSVIYAGMVGKVLAITAGKQIRIAFRKGNVTVSVPGSAFQSGALGDSIAVSPRNSGRQFNGTIVGPSEVVVEE